MYLDYFGFDDAPFGITPNTSYWFAGGQRGDMLAALRYAIGHGEGIIKVVGEVGSGKTMLCRMLAANLPDDTDSVYLGNPMLAADEILAAILSDLGVATPPDGRQARLALLNTVLLERHAAGRRVVVFVEEAQSMSLENLEFLRLLTNLETATDKLLQIVLFGQPELDAMLADPRIRQLRDRITLNLTLAPLDAAEVGDYLRTRLAVAGYRGPDLFPPALVARLARLSGGLSRRINVLADKTLLAAYAEQTRNLAPRHLDAAARDAQGPGKPRRRPHWGWVAGVLAAGAALVAFVVWQSQTAAGRPRPAATVPPAARQAVAAAPANHAPHTPDVAERARQTARWLTETAPDTHVIQVAQTKDARQAAVLLQDLQARGLPGPFRVLHGMSRGEPAWMLLAGEYPNRQAALAALRTLPRTGQQAPFLRTAGKMRTVVLATEP